MRAVRQPDTTPSSRLRSRVATFAATHRMLRGVRRILAGFSGGADSTALLLILEEMAPGRVTAVHLNHGLRGRDATRDAAWCEAFCAARGIPFSSASLDVHGRRRPGESLEAAARRCRLEFWQERAGPDTVVALGHHIDDRLEDLLLRLVRGANSTGLATTRPVRRLAGVRVIRPLLCLRRAEIETFLRATGIRDWCTDRSNRDTRFRRNAVRHELLPLIRRIAGTDGGLLATLDALTDDAALLEADAARRLAGFADARRAARLPAALFARTLRLWLSQELARDFIVSGATLKRLRHVLAARPDHPVTIPVGEAVSILVQGGRLCVTREGDVPRLRTRRWHWRRQPRLELPECGAALVAEPVTVTRLALRQGPAPDGELFAASALPETLTVRAWRAGDRMQPFGSQAGKKLQDLFTNAKVPAARRALVPVVCAGRVIVWAAGVRRAEVGRLPLAGAQVRRAVRLRLLASAPGAGAAP